MAGSTDFIEFIDALQDLKITGVRNLKEPPLIGEYNTDSGPVKWVDRLGMDNEPLYRGTIGGMRTSRGRIVVILKPVTQEENRARWSVTRQMVKRLNAAIEGMTRPGIADLRWTIDADTNFQDTGFYAVTAEVEGEG